MKNNKIIIPVLLITVLSMHLPFISQAFHIDDTYFLYVAKQILRDPIRPLSFQINWYGNVRMAFDCSGSPPLFEYYLALVMKFFGESGPLLHFSMITFSIIVCLCMYFLGKRFTVHPLSCMLLTVLTPAYLVMGHTIMLDVPALALFLTSITCFIYGLDNDKRFLLVCSGISCGLAALIKYNTLILVPLLFIYSFTKNGKIDKRILYLLIGIAIFLAYSYCTSLMYGKSHFSQAASMILSSPNLLKISLYFLALSSYIGGATIFPLIFIFFSFLLSKRNLGYYAVFIVSILVGFFARFKLGFTIAAALMLSLFIFSFFSFLYVVFREGIFRYPLGNKFVRDNLFLVSWIGVVISFHVLVVFVAVRFMLLLIPPVVILFYRILENKLGNRLMLVRQISVIAIVATCILGFLVSRADLLYANVYRVFSNEIPALFKTNENKIWYAGHWGFMYYMDKKNYTHIESFSTLPAKNDILIVPSRPDTELFSQDLIKRLRIIKVFEYNTSFPVRTMSEESYAGFYSSSSRTRLTFLPFSFSSSNLEKFIICEVIR